MSEKTPPAVTSAPAPGPLTMRGCFWYLKVVKAIMLSLPDSWEKAWLSGYLLSSTRPSFVFKSTTPTYLKTWRGEEGEGSQYKRVTLHFGFMENTSPFAAASALLASISSSN